MHFTFLSQKRIQLTNKLPLPLICTLLKSNLFTGFNLGTSHNIHWSMGIPHNKLMQNYVAHNNQLAVTVSFFQLNVYVQYDCSHYFKKIKIFVTL